MRKIFFIFIFILIFLKVQPWLMLAKENKDKQRKDKAEEVRSRTSKN